MLVQLFQQLLLCEGSVGQVCFPFSMLGKALCAEEMQEANCGSQFHKKLLELCVGLSNNCKTAAGWPKFILQHYTVINARLYIHIWGNNMHLAAEVFCLFLEIPEISTKCHIMLVLGFFFLCMPY